MKIIIIQEIILILTTTIRRYIIKCQNIVYIKNKHNNSTLSRSQIHNLDKAIRGVIDECVCVKLEMFSMCWCVSVCV